MPLQQAADTDPRIFQASFCCRNVFTLLICKNVQNMMLKFRRYPLVCLLPALQTHLRQLHAVTSQSPTTSSELRVFLRWWCMVVFHYWQCRYFRRQSYDASFERWSACRIRNKWATLQNDENDCYSLAVGLSDSHSFLEKDLKKITLPIAIQTAYLTHVSPSNWTIR